jgi:hypothetical protein
MAHRAGKVAFFGPSTVAIHDDGDVLRGEGLGLCGHGAETIRVKD